jgi:NhaP-type Na+/H+ and K+/H+ antiporter
MQIVDEYAFGGGNITSETVNWQINEEEEGLSYIMPIIIVIILGIIATGYILINRANIDEEN